MAEAWQPIDGIREIPFLVSSLVEKTTGQGSYDRCIGQAVVRVVRDNVEKYLASLKAENKT